MSAKSACSAGASRSVRLYSVGLGQRLEHAGGEQLLAQRPGLLGEAHAAALVLVVVLHQRAQRRHRIRGLVDDVEDHRVVDAHPRDQRLRRRVAQALERLLGPADHAVCRLGALELAELLRVVAGLGRRPRLLDRVLRRLHHHVAGRVEPRAPGAPGDLVELARLQDPLPRTVELGQPGEDHGADRDVDADAQRVRSADHLQQPGLGQLLHQPAVARQHAGVVDADAAADEPRQRPAEPGGEAEAADRVGDRRPLLARAQLRRHESLRALERRRLREVNDVDRRAIRPHELLEELVQRLQRPREVERHGPLGVVDEGRLAPGPPGQVLA